MQDNNTTPSGSRKGGKEPLPKLDRGPRPPSSRASDKPKEEHRVQVQPYLRVQVETNQCTGQEHANSVANVVCTRKTFL